MNDIVFNMQLNGWYGYSYGVAIATDGKTYAVLIDGEIVVERTDFVELDGLELMDGMFKVRVTGSTAIVDEITPCDTVDTLQSFFDNVPLRWKNLNGIALRFLSGNHLSKSDCFKLSSDGVVVTSSKLDKFEYCLTDCNGYEYYL